METHQVLAVVLVLMGAVRVSQGEEPCTSFLRPSLFPNVPPTLQFEYVPMAARTCPAIRPEFLLVPTPNDQYTTTGPPTVCRPCALFKTSLPPWITGNPQAGDGAPVTWGWTRIVFNTLQENGFRVGPTKGDWRSTNWWGIWADKPLSAGMLKAPHQKYSQGPYLLNLENKTLMTTVARRLSYLFPHKEPYQVNTFILPQEGAQFLAEWRRSKSKASRVWVLKGKSRNSSGVRLVTRIREVAPFLKKSQQSGNFGTHVIQEYLPNPLLIGGRKVELQMHVVVTGTMPLRAYISEPAATLARWGHKAHTMDPASFSDPCVHARPAARACPNTLPSTRLSRVFNDSQFERMYARAEEAVAGILLLSQGEVWEESHRLKLNRYSAFQSLSFEFFVGGNLTLYLNEVNKLTSVDPEAECGHVAPAVMNLVGYHLPPLSRQQGARLHKCLNWTLKSAPNVEAFEGRLYSTKLSQMEREKQKRVIKNLLEVPRLEKVSEMEQKLDDVLGEILADLTPDDVRYLVALFDAHARAEPHFRQLVPLRAGTRGRSQSSLQQVARKLKYYVKVLIPEKLRNVPLDGATSALYYYTLYEAYVYRHGYELRSLKQFSATGFHLQ